MEARLLRFSNTWEATGQLSKWVLWVGVFLSFLEEEKSVKIGEQNFLLPLFSARPFKTAPFWALFFLTVYETTPF